MALSFDEFRKNKGVASAAPVGTGGVPTGAASGQPVSGTPLDTGAGGRPRLTFAQFQAQKQQSQAPQVDPKVAQAVATSPALAAQTPQGVPQEATGADWERQAPLNRGLQAVGEAITGGLKAAGTFATEQIGGHAARMAALPYAVGTQLIPGGEDFVSTMGAATEFGKGSIAPFIQEEALPTIGALAATALVPEVAVPAAVAKYGPKVYEAMKVAPKVYDGLRKSLIPVMSTAGRGFIGAGAGESIEQVTRYTLGTTDAPEDFGDGVSRVTDRATQEALWAGGTAALLNMVGKAYHVVSGFGVTKDANKQALDTFIQENGLPKAAGDITHGLMGELHKEVVKNSVLTRGRFQQAKETQREALGKAIGEFQKTTAAKAGITEPLEQYQHGMLYQLPATVGSEHLYRALTQGRKVRDEIIGGGYEALDEVIKGGPLGTKKVSSQSIKNGWDSQGNPTVEYVPTTDEVPGIGVKMKPVQDKLSKLIDEQSVGLTPEAKVDFSQFARQQLRVFDMADEVPFGAARQQISRMKSELRDLQMTNQSQKAFFLQRAIGDMTEQVEQTGVELGKAGIMMPDGQNPSEFLKGLNKLWKEEEEVFGNKYVAGFIKKADEVEGAADSLAGAFTKNIESSKALLRSLEASEQAAGVKLWTVGSLSPIDTPPVRPKFPMGITMDPSTVKATQAVGMLRTPAGRPTQAEDLLMPRMNLPVAKEGESAFKILQDAAPTRAAIALKVFESKMDDMLNPAKAAAVMRDFSNPEQRQIMVGLMGDDAFAKMEQYTRAMKALSDDVDLDGLAASASGTAWERVVRLGGTVVATPLAPVMDYVAIPAATLLAKGIKTATKPILMALDDVDMTPLASYMDPVSRMAAADRKASIATQLMRAGADAYMEDFQRMTPEEQERELQKQQFRQMMVSGRGSNYRK